MAGWCYPLSLCKPCPGRVFIKSSIHPQYSITVFNWYVPHCVLVLMLTANTSAAAIGQTHDTWHSRRRWAQTVIIKWCVYKTQQQHISALLKKRFQWIIAENSYTWCLLTHMFLFFNFKPWKQTASAPDEFAVCCRFCKQSDWTGNDPTGFVSELQPIELRRSQGINKQSYIPVRGRWSLLKHSLFFVDL